MKRQLALILVFCMMLCFQTVSADSTNYNIKNYEAAVTILTKLGIAHEYAEDSFMPTDTVTRAEFAQMCCKLAYGNDFNEDSFNEDCGCFYDVSPSHWAYSYICALKTLGIISGSDDGMFYPDKEITQVQAVKMLVCLLGYGYQAESEGGYSAGYISQAMKLGIIKGTGIDANGVLSRGQMAVMLYNSLFIRTCETAVYNENYETKMVSDKTIMFSVFEMDSVKGIVTAVKGSAIEGGANIHENEVCIDNIAFICEDESAPELVGQKVEAYYTRNNDDPVIKVIVPMNNATNYIEKHDVREISKNSVIYTDSDGRQKKAPISKDAVWSVNNQPITLSPSGDTPAFFAFNGFDASDTEKCNQIKEYMGGNLLQNTLFSDLSGYIKIIDNNNDGSAEAVCIYLFQSLYVREVRTNDQSLLLTNVRNEQQKLTFDEKYTNAYFYLNDKLTDVNSVAKDGAVSIGCGIDANGETITNIWISSQSASGTVNAINTDDGEITLDQTVYRAADSAVSSVRPGEKVHMTLDFRGIVFYNNRDIISDKRCGYMIASAVDGGIGSVLKVKIFDETGINIYECAQKVKYGNGTFEEAVRKNAGDMAVILSDPQLIKFTLDNEGKIAEIETAKETNSLREKNSFTKNHSVDNYVHNFKTRADSRYYIDTTTKVFFIPDDLTDNEHYVLGAPSDMVQYNQYDKMIVYDVKDYTAQELVVHYNTDAGVIPTARYSYGAVITDICYTPDDEVNLEVYVKGLLKNYIIKSMDMSNVDDYPSFEIGSVKARDLKKGDILQIATQGDEIIGYRVIARINELSSGYYDVTNSIQMPDSDTYGSLYVGYGEIRDSYKRGFTFNARDNQAEEYDRVIILDNTVYVYKVETGKEFAVTPGSVSDISAGDKAIIHMGSSRVSDIYLLY